MTLQQLHYAITISETGSINKAAEILYVAQPSLTASMQDLEKEFRKSNTPQQACIAAELKVSFGRLGIRPSRHSPNIRASTATCLIARGNKTFHHI